MIGFSVLYTWPFDDTDGRLVFPHLFHAAPDVTLFVFPILPTGPGVGPSAPDRDRTALDRRDGGSLRDRTRDPVSERLAEHVYRP